MSSPLALASLPHTASRTKRCAPPPAPPPPKTHRARPAALPNPAAAVQQGRWARCCGDSGLARWAGRRGNGVLARERPPGLGSSQGLHNPAGQASQAP